MRSPVTEELISAYIDGEVNADEKAQVEQALAESAECRQLFEELQGLRSSLQSLPRFTLPDDFHQRVMRQAERAVLAPAPAHEPAVVPVGVRVSDSSQKAVRTWQTIALTAVAVAAALFFALVVVAKRYEELAPGGPLRPQDKVVTNTTDGVVPKGVETPGSELADGRRGFNRLTYILVVDLTITPKGQKNRVFEDALQKAGIQFDPTLTVKKDLEKVLLNSRFLAEVKKADNQAEKDAAADDISMVYVAGMGLALDSAITDLRRKRPRDEIARAELDLAIQPTDRAVFDQLNDAIRLASSDPSDSPHARRLVFGFSLHTASGSLLASLPTPRLTAELLPAEDKTPPQANAADQVKRVPTNEGNAASQPTVPAEKLAPQAAPQEKAENEPADSRYEVLFILRNLKDAPQAPEDQ